MTDPRAAEAIRELQEINIQCGGDVEGAHSMADSVLCKLLSKLGYDDVVAEWEKIEKWYA